jgi:HTH-type transcriptional regulator/antitoxin HigA
VERNAEADVLRELMRSKQLSQQGLANKVGMAQSTISAVVNGTRSLTKEQVVKLGRFFGVSLAAFLPS